MPEQTTIEVCPAPGAGADAASAADLRCLPPAGGGVRYVAACAAAVCAAATVRGDSAAAPGLPPPAGDGRPGCCSAAAMAGTRAGVDGSLGGGAASAAISSSPRFSDTAAAPGSARYPCSQGEAPPRPLKQPAPRCAGFPGRLPLPGAHAGAAPIPHALHFEPCWC